MDLYGNPTLQGGAGNLQGSQPNLQGGVNPQQASGVYGPPVQAPTVAQPSAPTAPVAPAPVSYGASVPPHLATPDAQINSIFSPHIGSRPSPTNPGVLEYYNKQTGQGFSTPQELFSYASQLGGGVIGSFDQLHAPVVQGATQNIQPASTPGQTTAEGAGTAGLSVDDYLKLLQSGTALTPDQISAIQKNLGIPEAAQAAFAPPSQSAVDFYNSLYGSSGLADVKQKIADLNSQVAQRQQDFLDAQGTINENPFLSEASRVGRVSRLNNKAQAEIKNLLDQQAQYQIQYQNGLGEINNLVTQHTADFTQNQQLNSQKLTFLLSQAEAQKTAQLAQNQQTAQQYLPAYLQAKAKAISPSTVTAPNGATFYYDKTTGTFQQLVGPGGNYDQNTITGDLYSKNTGQTLGASGGTGAGSFSAGSSAAVNNPMGLKPGGVFSQYPTMDAGFQAGVGLVQRYQNGTGPAGIDANLNFARHD